MRLGISGRKPDLMNDIVFTKLPKSQVKFEVTVPAEEVLSFKEGAARALAERLEIDGFRKGKAPYDIVKQYVGSARVFEEAAYIAMDKKYQEVVAEHKLRALGHPQVEILKIAEGNPLVFSVTIAVYPEVKLPDYKEIAKQCEKDRAPIEIKDEEVEKAVDFLRHSRRKEVLVSRPAQKGDLAEVDFEIRSAGVKIEGGESKNHPIILGEGKFIPGFEGGILGARAGEGKDFSISVPEDYAKESLRGSKLDVKAKINAVYELTMPELTDELAKTIGNFETARVLKDNIRDGLKAEKEAEEKERMRNSVIGQIADAAEMEVADILITQEINKMISELAQSVQAHGADLESYLVHIKKTKDDLKKDFTKQAEKRVRISLALSEIAEKEKIEFDEGEVKKKMEEKKGRLRAGETGKKDSDLLRDYVSGIMRNEKVFEVLEL